MFGDPLVGRGQLEYARLSPHHVLAQRVRAATDAKDKVPLLARRCLYRRRNSVLLVTEIFLPGVAPIENALELTPAVV